MSEPIIVTFANAADRRTCPNYRVSHTPSKHVSVMGCCRFARCVSELYLARPLHSPLDFFLGDETGRWLVEEVLFFENLNVEVPRLLLTLGLSGAVMSSSTNPAITFSAAAITTRALGIPLPRFTPKISGDSATLSEFSPRAAPCQWTTSLAR